MSYTVLLLDRDYITNEMLPALAQQHFRQTGDGFDYQLAVVSVPIVALVYHSTGSFSPKPDEKVDAAMDLFQVRMQDFGVDCLGDSAVYVHAHPDSATVWRG